MDASNLSTLTPKIPATLALMVRMDANPLWIAGERGIRRSTPPVTAQRGDVFMVMEPLCRGWIHVAAMDNAGCAVRSTAAWFHTAGYAGLVAFQMDALLG
jgi:hypothetical protein